MNNLASQIRVARRSTGLIALLCICVSGCTTPYDPEFKRKMSNKDEVVVLVDTFLIGVNGKVDLDENRKIAIALASEAKEQLQQKGYCVNNDPLLFTAFMEHTRASYFTRGQIDTELNDTSPQGLTLYDNKALTSIQAKAFMTIFEKLPHFAERKAEQPITFDAITKTGLHENTISCFILIYGRDVSFGEQLAILLGSMGFVDKPDQLIIEMALIDNSTGELIWKYIDGTDALAAVKFTGKMNQNLMRQDIRSMIKLIPTQEISQ